MPTDPWSVVKTEDIPAAGSDPWSVVKTEPDTVAQSAVHPALAGLPKPSDAVQQAELSAKQVADMLTQVGNQMHQSSVAKIPHELRGYTPQELQQPSDTFNRAGRRYTVGDELTPAPVLDAPLTGGKQVLDGAGQVASGLTEPSDSSGHTMGMYGVPLPAPPMNPTIAGGVAKVIGGGMEAATPLLPGALAAAPVPTLAGLGAGVLAQEGTEAGLKKAGVPDGYAELGGAGAGLVAGGVAGHLAARLGPKPAIAPDQVLGPERAPMGQQLSGEVAGVDDGLAGKQPVGSRTVKPGQPGAWEVVKTEPETKAPAAETAGEKTEATTKEGETNDNRTSVSVDGFGTAGRSGQGQEGQGGEVHAGEDRSNRKTGNQQGEATEKTGSAEKEVPGSAGGSAPAVDAGGSASTAANAAQEKVAQERERLAQELGGKSYRDLPYSKRQQIDQQIQAGQGAQEARPPQTEPAVGSPVDVNVPGEKTSYPARYSVRELADVHPSHNPHNFQPNPAYEYENDRDYSSPQNAARVAEYSAPGNFKPDYTVTPSPTAEQGAPVIDPRGNALGGNNRTMALKRVYANNPAGAQAYRDQLAAKASQFGIDPAELSRFKNPILTRELTDQPDKATAQKAITDFNKTAAARLGPEEQAVADGRRLSPRTIEHIAGNLSDVGDDSTLAQALRGDKGAEIVQSLVKDGVLTDQEKNGYLDERGQLTGEAKSRIAKALVGRLFEKPGDYAETAPELRNKLEQIVPQVLRVEDRPEWSVTQPVRDALEALADAKAHGLRNLDDLTAQPEVNGEMATYSPDALAIAKTLQQGPVKARQAFRQYANDAALSRDGAQTAFFEPPTQREAFDSAFRGGHGISPAEVAASKSLRPYNPKASDEVNLSNADARFLRGSGAGDGRLYLNEGAMRVFDRVIRDSWGNSVIDVATTNGLTVGRKLAPRVLQSLEGLAAQRGMSAAAASAVRRLAQTWRRAMEDGVDVVLASPDATAKFRAKSPDEASLRETVRHELIHREQLRLPGNSFFGHVQAGPLLDQPAVMKAARALLGGGYRAEHIPSEIPAFLGSGEYRRLGLSRGEALDALEHYFRLLLKQHGGKALSVLARVQPGLRKELYERLDGSIHRQPDGPGGSPPGDSGSGRDKPSERPPSPRGSEGRSGAPAADAAKPGPSGERLSKGRTKGTGGEVRRNPSARSGRTGLNDGESGKLFSDDELRATEKAANSDRAKLEADRLSKQFNSPLTRDEQVKKLKTSKSAQTDLFGDGKGPEQGMLFSLSKKLTKPVSEEEEGKLNYSGLGALEDVTTRNLSQLRRASPKAWQAAVKAAASKAEASVLIRTAVPKIEQALKGGPSFDDFRRTLIESRLHGLQKRWSDMADFALRASDQNIAASMERLLPLLEHMRQGKLFGDEKLGPTAAKLGQTLSQNARPDSAQIKLDLADTAASLAEKKDYQLLRKLLADTFNRAARSVTHVMTPDEFNQVRHAPTFQDGLRVYKDLMEKPMAESHESNEGVFSDALGPLDTYYPLVPVQDEQVKRLRTASKQQYAKPKNILNNFATGLSEDYDASMEAFRDRMTRAVKANNKAALMDALVTHGLVVPLKPFEKAGDLIGYRGQEYQAVRMETTPARVVVQNVKSTNLPASSVLVPKWLHKELEPVLQNQYSKPTLGLVHKIMTIANDVAISGPADFVWHSSNLFGTMVANTPFLGTSLLDKAASVPVIKRFAAIAKVLSVDPTTEEAAADLQAMAKLGMLPDRFAGETYSKAFAEQTGAKLRRLTAGPLLFGPKGIDVRARLVMYRLAKEINPAATGPQLHLFVNQLGSYVDSLQSQMERGAKHVGLSPFATAGTTMLRNGINAWTGQGPMPKDGAGLRVWQQLTGGAAAMIALWAVTHKAFNGKYPWEDKDSKLLSFPIRRDHLHSDLERKLYKSLWGDAPVGYVNFSFFNPIVGRGARAIGVKGAYDKAATGGKWWQDFEAAQKDVMNSFAHPFLGPIPRAAFVGLTGDEPTLTGLRDDRAKLSPQLMPAVRKAGEGSAIAKRAGAAAEELNSFFGNVAANSGLGESNAHDTTNRWERMVFDLVLPGLVANGQNPSAQRARTLREAAAARRQSLAK